MVTIVDKILEQNGKIERDISRIGTFDNGEICSDIISKLRTFVEHIAMYHYVQKNSLKNEITQSNVTAGIPFVNKDKELSFISRLHKCLQACASHYVISEVTSPRLIQKYLPYLLKIKKWLKATYGIDILNNLNNLMKISDTSIIDFYGPIKQNLLFNQYIHDPHPNERYYVYSCYPIIVDDTIIYEVTLGIASDFASKFNRFIVFSNEEIPLNYSIRCEFFERKINVSKYITAIKIVQDWSISIRPCELINFGKIFGLDEKVSSSSPEYSKLMIYLNQNKTTILELLCLNNDQYVKIKNNITSSSNESHIFNIFDMARSYLNKYYSEKNLIKYLAYNLNNKIIKNQLSSSENNINLFVDNRVIPFCKMPFAMSLVNHNPLLIDLIEIFGKPNEDELVYRKLKNATEFNNVIYHKLDELFDGDIEKIKLNIDEINQKLDWTPSSKIENIGDLYYLKYAEDTTVEILNKLMELSKTGVIGYSEFVQSKINDYKISIDSEEKKKIVTNLFSQSKVSCIYGPAGTGKSYLAYIISNIYRDSKKIYIANTNTAVNNLYRKIGGNINDFMTIKKYNKGSYSCDILFIDESSMVSNNDMITILSKNAFKCLVLMGDIIQIESIKFGNWYKMAIAFMNKLSKNELTEMHRTSSEHLKLLWSNLRTKENVIDEILFQYNMVKDLNDDSLFEKNDDEIVLALNYNGIYGINNLNNLMQENNRNASIRVWSYTYKIGDPIIFTDNNQFAPILYNNLKGEIVSFEKKDDTVTFVLKVDTVLDELKLCEFDNVKLLEVTDNKSLISIKLETKFDSDNDEIRSKLIPFQIAYAVSIHKSQGLEFENVKVVISNDVDKEITHNIFYTAVTRSSKNLTIYWSKDTENAIMQQILVKQEERDIGIFSSKFKYKIREKNLL